MFSSGRPQGRRHPRECVCVCERMRERERERERKRERENILDIEWRAAELLCSLPNSYDLVTPWDMQALKKLVINYLPRCSYNLLYFCGLILVALFFVAKY